MLRRKQLYATHMLNIADDSVVYQFIALDTHQAVEIVFVPC